MIKLINVAALVGAGVLVGCSGAKIAPTEAPVVVTSEAVVETYIDIAAATYSDSLFTAKELQLAINRFLENPTDESLLAAKDAWTQARAPYQQTEVYRFGNEVVDSWEGKVNAWPLDEGLIDYVATSYGTESDENGYYTANIIAQPKLTIGGTIVDASHISKAFLSETLHEIDEIESNVATGYHVIEFLLWGQDLNGNEQGAGNRPATDFSLDNCTGGNCDRRRAYLKVATDLLVDDLQDMAKNWSAEGAATKDLQSKGTLGSLTTMLTGMGSLAYGELAGERTKLGLMLHDPEEEHDCFSDNTHWSHYYDAKGIKNIYTGHYIRVNGDRVKGASLSDLVKAKNPALNDEMLGKLQATENAMQKMVDQAAKGNTFDVLIGASNKQGNKIVKDVVDALVSQTRTTEKIIVALGLENISIEGSDSLDNPSSIN